MMKKTIATIAISGIIVSSLMAGEINSVDFSKYPIPQDLTSVSRGGTLPDKLSASDGMGTLMLPKVGNDNSKLDNSAFNKLLKTNKNKLTDTNSLNDLISSGDITVSQAVLDKINNINISSSFSCSSGLILENGNRCYTNDLCIIGESDGNGNCIVSDLKFKTISLHHNVTCGIETITGNTYCWGANSYGQLGDGTTTNKYIPTKVNTDLKFSQIVVGGNHTCGIETITGDTYCWGVNNYGQLGDGTTTNKYIPTKVNTDLKFSSIVLSFYSITCGIETITGDAYCWGRNSDGQLGDGTTTNRYIPTKVNTDLKFSIIKTSYRAVCGIDKVSGDTYCWGYNYYGQLGDGTTTNRHIPTKVNTDLKFSQIFVGNFYNCGIDKVSGDTYCWGDNSDGRVGDGTSTNRHIPTKVNTDLKFSMMSTKGDHSMAVDSITGDLYGWGRNDLGELGDGTTTNRHIPTKINTNIKFSLLKTGGHHNCGIETITGYTYCWGYNYYGQLGDGTTNTLTPPTKILGIIIPEGCTDGFTEDNGKCWIPAIEN